MSESDRFALLERILSLNLAWIAAADAKVAPILAVDTAMLGVLAALVPKASGWLTLPAIVTAMGSLLLLVSLACLVAVVFPRLSGPKGSLLFFGGIATLDREQYVARIKAVSETELFDDIAAQVHRNAQIADAKFSCVRWAFILLFAAIPVWLLAVSLLYAHS